MRNPAAHHSTAVPLLLGGRLVRVVYGAGGVADRLRTAKHGPIVAELAVVLLFPVLLWRIYRRIPVDRRMPQSLWRVPPVAAGLGLVHSGGDRGRRLTVGREPHL